MAEKIRFTKTSIMGLPIPTGTRPVKYRDGDSKLYLYAYPIPPGKPPDTPSTKMFRLVTYVPAIGKPRDIKIGEFAPSAPGGGFYTVEMARNKANDILSMIREGKDPVSEKKREKEKLDGIPTLRELRDEYVRRKRALTGRKKLSERTAKLRYEDDFERYGAKLLDLKISDINFWVLDKHIAKLLQEKPREKAIDIWIRAWSAIYSFGSVLYPEFVHPKLIKDVRESLHISKSEPRERTIQDHELPILYDYIYKLSSLSGTPIETSTSADFFYFLLFAGCRMSEAKRLEWADVHLDQNPPYLFFRKTKNEPYRQIPISEPVQNLLGLRKALRPQSPYVFPGPSKAGHITQPKNFITRFRDAHKTLFKVDEETGKPDRFAIHDFRRTWLTIGVQKCPIIPIKRLVGHSVSSSDVTEKVYYQPSIEQLYETAEIVVKLILEKCLRK